nr:lipid II flippase MurJ [Streptomyces aidingensis]
MAAGALCGLLRDQTVAHLYGAGGDTDAFLVAWTLPEVAATLLIEDGMALLLVPAFSVALARRAAGAAQAAGRAPADPVRALLAATLPGLLLVLTALAGLLALGAPLVVRLLAPGIADPGLAADCTRLTALTAFTFGISGYLSAVLRAHRCFAPPAAIYVVYNAGIVGTALALHAAWGVRGAAAGVAVGSALMVLLQLPFFLRRLPVLVRPAARAGEPAADIALRSAARTRAAGASPPVRAADLGRTAGRAGMTGGVTAGVAAGPPLPAAPDGCATPAVRSAAGSRLVLGAGLVAPVALFALSRQAQVLVERFLASALPPGAISHLNYAQKVAQLPMTLSLMICTVTLPLVARAIAEGDTRAAARRVERDLTLAAALVLAGAAYVAAFAPQIVELLFQRGAFDAHATAATAAVMRVYALGLLGHTLVGTLVRPFFAAARPTWYPLAAMSAGLLITVAAGVPAVPAWGAPGMAAANAVGITVTAGLLLHGLRRRMLPLRPARVLGTLGRLLPATAAAGVAGWGVAGAVAAPALAAGLGAVLVPAVFVAAARAARVPETDVLLTAARRAVRRGTRNRKRKQGR